MVIRGGCCGSGRGSSASGSASSKPGRGLGSSTAGRRGALPVGLLGAGSRGSSRGTAAASFSRLFRLKDCSRVRLLARLRSPPARWPPARKPIQPASKRRRRVRATLRLCTDHGFEAQRRLDDLRIGPRRLSRRRPLVAAAAGRSRPQSTGASAAGFRQRGGRPPGVGTGSVSRARGSGQVISGVGSMGAAAGGSGVGARAASISGASATGGAISSSLSSAERPARPSSWFCSKMGDALLTTGVKVGGSEARRRGIQQTLQVPAHAIAIRPLLAWRSASISRT